MGMGGPMGGYPGMSYPGMGGPMDFQQPSQMNACGCSSPCNVPCMPWWLVFVP